ncbi:MAG: ABC transporter ATP-binding protein [Gammaproteobacteria bacterium]
MSTVTLEDVTKRYGTTAALDAVSLDVGQGEFFALLGPSGSGKTTLLRAVAGFVAPDRGQVRIGEASMEHVPVSKRNIGMVFQHYALFPHMNVFDNVAFGLAVRRVSKSDTRRRVQAMLELVELGGLNARKPAELSGGQQQRVAIARALIPQPQVLLLDEPLGALDRRLRQQMQIELKRIQREVGITTLFVTHDQEEALTLSDRIALMNDGKVVQTGAPAEVYEAPRTRFAAGFLGDTNVLEGVVVRHDGGQPIVDVGDGVVIHAKPGATIAEGRVVLAIRPEKIAVADGGRAPAPSDPACNVIEGKIASAVYAGSSITYRVQCAALTLTVFEQNSAAAPHAAGEKVRLCWPAEHTVLLDS